MESHKVSAKVDYVQKAIGLTPAQLSVVRDEAEALTRALEVMEAHNATHGHTR